MQRIPKEITREESKRALEAQAPITSRMQAEFGKPSMNDEWGGASVINQRTPSGVSLLLHCDDDCILRYLGRKDISDVMGKPDGSVIYFSFFDGRTIISLPASYAFRELQFQQDFYYYIWHQGDVDMGTEGKNPMKDFLIRQLGRSGNEIQVPERVSNSKLLTLSDQAIEQINYSRLNYPLRP